MPVYEVTVQEVVYHKVEINACDEEVAMDLAEDAVLADKRGAFLGSMSSKSESVEAIGCETADPLFMNYEE